MTVCIGIVSAGILEDDVLLGELGAIPSDDHDLLFSLIEFSLVLFTLNDLLNDGWLG